MGECVAFHSLQWWNEQFEQPLAEDTVTSVFSRIYDPYRRSSFLAPWYGQQGGQP